MGDELTGDIKIFAIQIAKESVFDYHGLDIGMPEDKVLALMGTPSDTLVENGGEGGYVYYYFLDNGNVITLPFFRAEEETSPTLDMILYTADEFMIGWDFSVEERTPG